MRLVSRTGSLSRMGEGQGEGDRAWHEPSLSPSNVARRKSLRASRIGRLPQFSQDALQYGLDVGEHLVVPESQNAKLLHLQDLTALAVTFDLLRVLATIDLDDKTMFHAAEVYDELADGLLATELCCRKLAGSQPRPEEGLCIGVLGTQPARSLAQHNGSCFHEAGWRIEFGASCHDAAGRPPLEIKGSRGGAIHNAVDPRQCMGVRSGVLGALGPPHPSPLPSGRGNPSAVSRKGDDLGRLSTAFRNYGDASSSVSSPGWERIKVRGILVMPKATVLAPAKSARRQNRVGFAGQFHPPHSDLLPSGRRNPRPMRHRSPVPHASGSPYAGVFVPSRERALH
jgi:hypothetical protein